jgi:Ca-activated chloride channel homolog
MRVFQTLLPRSSQPRRAMAWAVALLSSLAFALSLAACGSMDAHHGGGSDSGAGYGNGNGNGTNIGFGGEQDFAYFRTQLENGIVPHPDVLQASGFFAEHHTSLPPADCGAALCLHPMLGVAPDLLGGSARHVLQIGINTPIELDPEDRPDLDLSLSIDVSGSMSADNRIGYVRRGLDLMLDELFDDDRIAIIVYSSDASVRMPMTRVGDARDEIRAHIESLQAGGMTALYAGLELAYQEAQKHYDPEREARVVMLSDGQANVGPSSNEEILAMSREYNLEGVGLTTIGLGDSFNVELMRGLAEQGDGNYYYVGNAADVQDVFTTEVHSFTVPVARDVLIEVDEGRTYRFEQAWGSPRWESRDDGGSLDLPAVFAAFRKSHDDTTDQGGRRGGGSALLLELTPRAEPADELDQAHVASIRFSYTDPELGERVEQEIDVDLPHHPLEVPDEGTFRPGRAVIMKSFAMLHAYLALKQACQLFHEGRSEDALDLLATTRDRLEPFEARLNDGEGDEDIQRDLEIIAQLEDVIARQ